MTNTEKIAEIKAECDEAKMARWAVKRNCPGFALRALYDFIPYLLDEISEKKQCH